MRDEPLATINTQQPCRLPDRPHPQLLSISWTEFQSGESGEQEMQVQHVNLSGSANSIHLAFDYTPRPEGWGINEKRKRLTPSIREWIPSSSRNLRAVLLSPHEIAARHRDLE